MNLVNLLMLIGLAVIIGLILFMREKRRVSNWTAIGSQEQAPEESSPKQSAEEEDVHELDIHQHLIQSDKDLVRMAVAMAYQAEFFMGEIRPLNDNVRKNRGRTTSFLVIGAPVSVTVVVVKHEEEGRTFEVHVGEHMQDMDFITAYKEDQLVH